MSRLNAENKYSMSLRICHLGKYYSPARGGVETHVRTLARAQASLGAEVFILCVNHESPRRRCWKGRNGTQAIAEWDGPVQVRRLPRLLTLSRWDVCPGIRQKLLRLTQHADVLHLHVPNVTMMLALATIPFTVPLVITYHSDIVRQRWLYRLLQPFEKAVFQRAACVLAATPRHLEGSRVLQRYAKKFELCPYGIDPAPFATPSIEAREFQRNLSQQFGSPLWLCVGRLVYYKGFDVALQALTRVPGRLLLVGRGPLEPKLRGLAKKLGVADRVIWKTELSDSELAGAYHAATALWLPSNARSEAFGLVQVEAMASGCPVINTNIPGSGVPWVSPHDETGLTIPMCDPDALADVSRRLLHESGLRSRLAANGPGRTSLMFSQDIMAQRTLAVYREVRTGRRDPSGALRCAA